MIRIIFLSGLIAVGYAAEAAQSTGSAPKPTTCSIAV